MSQNIFSSSTLTAATEFLKNPTQVVGSTGTAGEVSANALQQATVSITQQNWYSKLKETLTVFNDNLSNFDQPMIDGWNNISNTGEILAFDLLGIYGKSIFFDTNILDSGVYPAEFAQIFDLLRSATITSTLLPTGATLPPGFQTSLELNPQFVAANFGIGSVGPGANIVRFSQILGISQSYVDLQNRFIDSSNAYADDSIVFAGMDNWITGGISDLNPQFKMFGEDLIKSGNLLDFENLSTYGNPGFLLGKIIDNQLIGLLIPYFEKNQVDIQSAIVLRSANSAQELKKIYNSYSEVSGEDLNIIKQKLRIRTDNISTLTDLLDTKKIFPNSFTTFRAPTIDGFANVYVNQAGSVNQVFNTIETDLVNILPNDVAVSSAALALSFGQIGGIFSTNAVDLGTAILNLLDLDDLSVIKNQTELLLRDVKETWLNSQVPFALGSDVQGRIRLSDIIGSVCGIGITEFLQKNQLLFQQAEQSGLFNDWVADGSPTSSSTGFYKVLQYFAQGEYGPTPFTTDPVTGEVTSWRIVIPAGVKGAGTYINSTAQLTRQDAWVQGLLPAVVNGLRAITARNFKLIEQINKNTTSWHDQILREQLNQTLIFDRVFFDNFGDLPAGNKEDALNFATQLEKYALDAKPGGVSQIIEGIANRNTRAGQSLIAAIRESRNKNVLTNIGIIAQPTNAP